MSNMASLSSTSLGSESNLLEKLLTADIIVFCTVGDLIKGDLVTKCKDFELTKGAHRQKGAKKSCDLYTVG